MAVNERSFRSKDEVRAALEDLKSRLPAHSVKPAMLEELEYLEELLESFAKQESD